MVTFFCPGCAQYLKKRQAEEHPQRCQETLACIQCRREFSGAAQIKAHTDCHPANFEPKRRVPQPPVADTRPVFNGLKNTARRILKRSPWQRATFAELKARLSPLLPRAGPRLEELEALLRAKLPHARNVRITGETLSYCPATPIAQ